MSQSQLEQHVVGIINIFYQNSVRVGPLNTLNSNEFAQMLKKEFPYFLKFPKNPAAIEKLFREVDKNKDRQISFGEFMQVVARVAIASHEYLHADGLDTKP